MRYFVDIRVGCAALVDRGSDSYDPDYPGLHPDTGGVVRYFSYVNEDSQYKDGDHLDKEMKIAYLEKLCSQYNKPKPRTKKVYEKVDDLIFNLKDDLDNGKLYGINGNGSYWKIATTHTLAGVYKDRELYRKVEKEIDWKDEVKSYIESVEYLSKNDMIKSVYNGDEYENDEVWESEFIGMCHLVVSLTDKPE